MANTYLEGTYSEVYPPHRRGRGGATAPVSSVLLARRHPVARGAGDARLDPRGRRARLRARARLRGGFRQPGPARAVRGGRRGGRDRPAGRELALHQVREPRPRRRRAPGPAPQRLQDRQPHRPRSRSRRRAAFPARGLRALAALRRGRRPRRGASGARCGAGLDPRRDRLHPGPSPRWGRGAPALAHDRPAHPQGLDWAQGSRRQARGGQLPVPPGPARQAGREPRAPERTRALAALLPAGGAVPRGRRAARGAARAASRGRTADGRQPARQRRQPAARPRAARLPRLRRRSGGARRDRQRGNARPGRLAARCHAREPHVGELPRVRPRRDRFQPARRAASRRRTASGWPTAATATTTSHRTAG